MCFISRSCRFDDLFLLILFSSCGMYAERCFGRSGGRLRRHLRKEVFSMLNKVVLHFVEGKILKGTTDDFFPNKDSFHLREKEVGVIQEVHLAGVKAVYFVKSFEGSADYRERND